MMQVLEGSYRVARTKVRHHEALAGHDKEHDERARKMAKHGHHEAGPTQRQSCHHRHAVRSDHKRSKKATIKAI